MKKYAILIALVLLFIAGCGENQFINKPSHYLLQEKGAPSQISPDGYGGKILTYTVYDQGTSRKYHYFVDSNDIVYKVKTPSLLKYTKVGKYLDE